MQQHVFYDDTVIVDLRYLVGAELITFDHGNGKPLEYAIGFLLAMDDSRLSATYKTQALRDQAFERLVAMHQAWGAFVHAHHQEHHHDDD